VDDKFAVEFYVASAKFTNNEIPHGIVKNSIFIFILCL